MADTGLRELKCSENILNILEIHKEFDSRSGNDITVTQIRLAIYLGWGIGKIVLLCVV